MGLTENFPQDSFCHFSSSYYANAYQSRIFGFISYWMLYKQKEMLLAI